MLCGPRDTASPKPSTPGPTVACKALGCHRVQSVEALLGPYSHFFIKTPWSSRTLLQRQGIHCGGSRWFPSGWQCRHRMRRCTWRCLMSENPMAACLQRRRHGHHTRLVVPQTLAFTAPSTRPAATWTQHAHVQTSNCLGAGILRCSTCIALSSIASFSIMFICSGARRTRTVQLLSRLILAGRLTSPVGEQQRGSCSQHCPRDIAHDPMEAHTLVPKASVTSSSLT